MVLVFPNPTPGGCVMDSLAQLAQRFANTGTAAETAYVVLREAIMANTLLPGARLLADDLARQLGVSKTPVREALRKLQAEDLIEIGPGNALRRWRAWGHGLQPRMPGRWT
jgi:DNA-binding GntR family transcriptional regulator